MTIERIPLSPNGDYSGEVWNLARLIEFRKFLALSAADLAEAVKISEANMVAIENGSKPFCEPLRSRLWRVIDRKFNARAEREAQRTSVPAEVLSDPTGAARFNWLFPKRKP